MPSAPTPATSSSSSTTSSRAARCRCWSARCSTRYSAAWRRRSKSAPTRSTAPLSAAVLFLGPHLRHLEHAIKLEVFALDHQRQPLRVGVGGAFLAEQHVEIIEFRPVQPERRIVVVRALGRENELRDRRRRAVTGVGETLKV